MGNQLVNVCFGSKAAAQNSLDTSTRAAGIGEKQTLATHQLSGWFRPEAVTQITIGD